MNPINVTKSYLPTIDEYITFVKRAFNNNHLTNRGELVKELEDNHKTYLKLDKSKILLMNNGTIPLQIALKLLGNGGEIITTPFSYVATTSAIIWEYCTPIFVDINPEYLTIDENKIEAEITERTTCILATHVFGNPCNIEAIEALASKHNLKVIYDAAHCFGVKYKGMSIFEYGDVSTCSFHATKLFHTGEGGAIFCKDKNLYDQVFLSHAFGHLGDNHIQLGINGKMSELSAAMGLAILPHMNEIFQDRRSKAKLYDELLDFSIVSKIKIRDHTDWNFSYYPVIFENESKLLIVIEKMNNINIFPRRYFYPSLNLLPYVFSQKMPISEDISKRILCLPLYYDLPLDIILKIVNIINQQ
jgi:dTDP-4-amino-4,6-dideoxygalactose transaminase